MITGATAVVSYLWSLVRGDEEGQGLAEYALILVGVALAAIVILGILGTNIATILSTVAVKL